LNLEKSLVNSIILPILKGSALMVQLKGGYTDAKKTTTRRSENQEKVQIKRKIVKRKQTKSGRGKFIVR